MIWFYNYRIGIDNMMEDEGQERNLDRFSKTTYQGI